MKENNLYKMLDTLTIEETEKLLANVNIPSSEVFSKKIIKRTVSKLKKQNKIKWYVPVAVCAVGLAVTFGVFPQTTIAIKEFFNKMFNISSYMNTVKDERANIAEIDQITQTNIPQNDFKVLIGEEMANWESILANRQQENIPNVNTEDYAWLKNVSSKLNEVVFDGNKLYINFELITDNPLPFYRNSLTVNEENQWIEPEGAVLNIDGKTIYGSGNIQYDKNAYLDESFTVNEEYVLSKNSVPLSLSFDLQDTALQTGSFPAEIILDLNDTRIDMQSEIGKVAQIVLNTSIDTSQGNNTKEVTNASTTVYPKGTVPITVAYEEAPHTYGNIEANLDGMEIALEEIEKLQTGIQIKLNTKLPNWDSEILNGYISGYSAKNGGLKFKLIIDGIDNGIVQPTLQNQNGEVIIDIPILSSELESIKSLALIPVIEYMSAFNGESVPMNDKKTFNLKENEGWEDTTEFTELSEYIISII